MKELSERDDTIITKTNKDGAAVIVAVKDYITEAERQLNNTLITTTSSRSNSNKQNSQKNNNK